MRYEKKVVKKYKSAAPKTAAIKDNFWVEFEDACGYGNAQADLIQVFPDRVFVFEIKLTAFDKVEHELQELYIPLFEELYSRPAIGIHVFRNSRPFVSDEVQIRDSNDLAVAQPGIIHYWHLIL